MRRFSDLDWLHTKLCEMYKGFTIPPLPPKDSLRWNITHEFLEKRRAEMEKCLQIIADHPQIGQDQTFLQFLELDTDEFDLRQKEIDTNGWNYTIPAFEDVVDTVYSHATTEVSNLWNAPVMPSELSNVDQLVSRMRAPVNELCERFDSWVVASKETMSMFEILVGGFEGSTRAAEHYQALKSVG
jgi:hypothetical protein